MKKIIAEPLVQFLALGLILYLLVELVAPGQLNVQNAYKIEVDDEKLLAYLQFQRKSFNKTAAEKMLGGMSAERKHELKKGYIRDEVLFREALALQLNENDEIIRRRLIQKMEYLAQGFYDDIPPISEEVLAAFFENNIEQYRIAAAITFTHIFIASSTDNDSDQKKITQLLKKINQTQVNFEQSSQYGDRFLYNVNYIERTPAYISSHFGKAFQKSIFSLNSDEHWQGPIQSDHGLHLVLVKDKVATSLPALSEVAGFVLADARREQLREIKSKAITALIDKYTITNTAPLL